MVYPADCNCEEVKEKVKIFSELPMDDPSEEEKYRELVEMHENSCVFCRRKIFLAMKEKAKVKMSATKNPEE